jgi:TPR repeat protein
MSRIDLHGIAMNETDKFALVQRPPGALEKVKPGAKRILSVMIADALASIPQEAKEQVEGWIEKGTSCFTPGNYAEALKWYRKAAERNHAKAQYFLGVCYLNGWGAAEDEMEGIRWFHKSAESGHTDAQRQLGDFYQGKQDYTAAINWYRKAAEQGDFSSQRELGDFYHDGKGVPKDYIEAVKWYRMAADQNLSTAQCSLGSCYRDGHGVAKDYSEAMILFRKAAEQNFAEAQFNLGLAYEEGKGVAQDYKQAVLWYRKAAAQGFSDAEERLGVLYANGRAIIDIRDAVDTYQWVKLAEANDCDGAVETMAVITALLSPEELVEAERRYQNLCDRKNWLYERVKNAINNG